MRVNGETKMQNVIEYHIGLLNKNVIFVPIMRTRVCSAYARRMEMIEN